MHRNHAPAALALLVLAGFAAATTAGEPRALPWAFRPVRRPALPAVRDVAWGRDDLDRFILARLEAAGLKPNPDADRPTLLRRLAFDLTGLPPTVAEVEAFCADRTSDDEALARVVDGYLHSPRFGERWGRHWLDVVRYADSVGRSWNAPFTYAWRYRDYVVDASNEDRPFDRFVIEQLAGDLLPAGTVARERTQRRATGFLALGAVPLQEGSRDQFLLDRVDDQIDVTTRAFLALTVACARCHDHKYDPITQQDYYALAGIFTSTRTFSGQGSRAERNTNYVDPHQLIRLPGAARSSLAGGIHSMADFMAEGRQRQRRNVRYTTDPDLAMGVTEGEIGDCAVRIKGDPYERGPTPPRGAHRIPGLPSLPHIPADASGRLQLARWIAAPQNPLTARVLVNRVWLHLFGRGLVPTVDNFGTTGEPPTHPDLLDHLADLFVRDGWSVKKLIRSIVLSRTYRLGSGGQKAGADHDPQNLLYGRANRRRLELEAVRDSLLRVAGRLAFERPVGIQVAGIGGKGRGMATHSLLALDSPYRTVYLPVLRNLLPEVYGTFDFPDPCQIMGRREVTTVAPQALFFMNSALVADCARDAARLLLKQPDRGDADRVRRAYLHLLGRAPVQDEIEDALELLRGASSAGGENLYPWTVLVQALMASAEFRTVR